MNKKKIKNLQNAGWNIGSAEDFLREADKRLLEIEDGILKQEIKIERLKGEWQGTLEGICMWDIPQKLKEKLEKKIKLLRNEL